MDGQQSYALLQDALKSQEITQIVYENIYGVDEAINSKKRVDPTKVVDIFFAFSHVSSLDLT